MNDAAYKARNAPPFAVIETYPELEDADICRIEIAQSRSFYADICFSRQSAADLRDALNRWLAETGVASAGRRRGRRAAARELSNDELLNAYVALCMASNERILPVERERRNVERAEHRAELLRRMNDTDAVRATASYRSTRDIPSVDGHKHAWEWYGDALYCTRCKATLLLSIEPGTEQETAHDER